MEITSWGMPYRKASVAPVVAYPYPCLTSEKNQMGSVARGLEWIQETYIEMFEVRYVASQDR